MDQIKGIQKYQQVTMVTSSTIKNPWNTSAVLSKL
jgi:hypothetical protein